MQSNENANINKGKQQSAHIQSTPTSSTNPNDSIAPSAPTTSDEGGKPGVILQELSDANMQRIDRRQSTSSIQSLSDGEIVTTRRTKHKNNSRRHHHQRSYSQHQNDNDAMQPFYDGTSPTSNMVRSASHSPNFNGNDDNSINAQAENSSTGIVLDESNEAADEVTDSSYVSSDDESETRSNASDDSTSSLISAEENKSSKNSPDHVASTPVATYDAYSFKNKNDEFVRMFKLPPDEKVVEDFSCAYYKRMIYQGRMYISQNYVCFNSNLVVLKAAIVIDFKDIVAIDRKSTALFVPNAIEIITKDNSYFFGSMLFRDQTYTILVELWKIHNKMKSPLARPRSLPSSLMRTHLPISDQGSDSNNESGAESALTSDEESDLSGNEEEESESNDNGATPTDSNAAACNKNDMTEQMDDATTSAASSPENASNATSENQAEALKAVAAGTEADADEPPIPDLDDEDNYDSPEQLPPNDTFKSESDLQFKDALELTYDGISVRDIYRLLFSDASTFNDDYHIARGDTEVSCTKWEKAPDGAGKIRIVKYTSPVKVPLGPKTAAMIEHQRRVFFANKTRLLLQTCSGSNEIPYGDCFRIQAKLDFMDTSTDPAHKQCKVVSRIGVHFLKSTLFRRKIEDAATKEATESVVQFWQSVAAAKIEQEKLRQVARQHKAMQARAASSPALIKTSTAQQKPNKTTDNKKDSSSSKKSRHDHHHSSAKKKKSYRKSAADRAPAATQQHASATAPVAPQPPPQQQPARPAQPAANATASATTTTARSTAAGLFSTLMSESVSMPYLYVFIIVLLLLCLVLPVQYFTVRKIASVENSFALYKAKSSSFEAHLSHMILDLSRSAEAPSPSHVSGAKAAVQRRTEILPDGTIKIVDDDNATSATGTIAPDVQITSTGDAAAAAAFSKQQQPRQQPQQQPNHNTPPIDNTPKVLSAMMEELQELKQELRRAKYHQQNSHHHTSASDDTNSVLIAHIHSTNRILTLLTWGIAVTGAYQLYRMIFGGGTAVR
eukprot:GEZU01039148.1.p1 GENE.GEZU01039148.1~~GEZU01039148.1.p1  ORF type:complete len:1014 (-),score=252.34 GEZU01039148.1:13-3054(-)